MPAKSPSRQAIALAVLLVVFVVVAFYEYRSFGPPGAAAPAAQAKPESSRVAAARDRAAAVPELRLSSLKALASEPAPTIGRNPFREKPVPPPVIVGRPGGPGSEVPFTGPPPPSPPPPITLRLVAIVRGSGRPIVALSDGRDVFWGREGDVVEGRYKIIKVNVESVDISYVDGRGQRRIGLTG